MAFGFTYTLPTITGSHSNFPVVLRTADFPSSALDGTGDALANGGGDLIAYTDDDKGTQIPVEVLSLVSSGSPAALIWVKIPTAATSNTIYIEADDTQTVQPAADSTYGSEAVWADYDFAYHAENVDSSTLTDAAGNNDVTVSGGAVSAGAVGNVFDPDGGVIDQEVTLTATSGYTLSMIANRNGSNSDYVFDTNPLDADRIAVIYWSGNYRVWEGGSITGGADVADSTDAHIDVVCDGTDTLLYINGSLITTYSDWGTVFSSSTRIAIGNAVDNSQPWPGAIDEIWLSASERDANWISTKHANLSAASNWGTVGSWTETEGGGGSVSPHFYYAQQQ